MITFSDDHEAELWRTVYTSFASPLAMEHTDCEPHEIAHDAGVNADAAVLEYRKRCGSPSVPDASLYVECPQCDARTEVDPEGTKILRCWSCNTEVTR